MFNLTTYPFKAIIFDCDGTIADNMPLHYQAWVHAIATNGAKFKVTANEIVSLAGKGIHEIVEIFNTKYEEKLDAKQVSKSKDDYFSQHAHEIGPIPEVLNIIHQYSGKIPMSVASGSRTDSVNQTLKHLKLDHILKTIITIDDVTLGKPAPDMFLLAAEKMGINPEDCIVFEDGDLGIEAAEKCGMKWFRVNARL